MFLLIFSIKSVYCFFRQPSTPLANEQHLLFSTYWHISHHMLLKEDFKLSDQPEVRNKFHDYLLNARLKLTLKCLAGLGTAFLIMVAYGEPKCVVHFNIHACIMLEDGYFYID